MQVAQWSGFSIYRRRRRDCFDCESTLGVFAARSGGIGALDRLRVSIDEAAMFTSSIHLYCVAYGEKRSADVDRRNCSDDAVVLDEKRRIQQCLLIF